MRLFLSLMAASLLAANVAEAAGGCGTAACRIQSHSCMNCNAKTCQVVCDMVKVKKTVWVVECEEFCPMLPGCRNNTCRSGCRQGCGHGMACRSCSGKDSCDPCAALQNRLFVPPKSGHARSRKKLVKKTITCEVPVYRSVVADSCSECGTGEAAPAAAPTPAKKVTAAAPLPPLMSGGR